MNPHDSLRTLVLSVPIGAGHHRAAEALCASIADLRPGSSHHILDSLKYLGPDGGKIAKDLYFGVIDDVPELWGAFYQQGGLSKLFRPANEIVDDVRSVTLSPEVKNFRPDVLLAMHPLACGLASSLRRTGDVTCPVVAVLTDFDAHPTWICRGIDLYLTATEKVASALDAHGLPSGKAMATGIPLRPQFTEIRSQVSEHSREKLGLDPSRLTVLMMGGGLGLGPIGEVARSLATMTGPLQLVLICGKNKELETMARGWVAHASVPLHVTGLVENVWDYIAASDLAIGKPGGLTCAEMLAAGVPLIALDPIPGQEQANCDVLVREGAAIEAKSPASACGTVLELLSDPSKIAHMQQAALKLGRPMASRVAARRVISLVETWDEKASRDEKSIPQSELDPLSKVARSVASDVDEFSKSIGLDKVAEKATSEIENIASDIADLFKFKK